MSLIQPVQELARLQPASAVFAGVAAQISFGKSRYGSPGTLTNFTGSQGTVDLLLMQINPAAQSGTISVVAFTAGAVAEAQVIFQVDDKTATNRLVCFLDTNLKLSTEVFVGGVSRGVVVSDTTIVANEPGRLTVSWTPTQLTQIVLGGDIKRVALTAPMATTVQVIRTEQGIAGVNPLNGSVNSIATGGIGTAFPSSVDLGDFSDGYSNGFA